jgi:hypothetical protein
LIPNAKPVAIADHELCHHTDDATTLKALDIKKYEGVIVMNISSWSGGASPWGTGKKKQTSTPSFGDGLVEAFGITGAAHAGSIAGGLRSGERIGQ